MENRIITRRGFLQTCLSLAAAPAIVKASSLMRCKPASLILPEEWERSPMTMSMYVPDVHILSISCVIGDTIVAPGGILECNGSVYFVTHSKIITQTGTYKVTRG